MSNNRKAKSHALKDVAIYLFAIEIYRGVMKFR